MFQKPTEQSAASRAPLVSAAVLLAMLSITVGSVAQAQEQAPFRAGVTEVIVPVTVTDDKGRFVSDLTRSDFHVLDEGKEQKIDFFSHQQ